MKLYKSPLANTAYFAYRVVSPIIDPLKFFTGILNYVWFIQDYIKFNSQAVSHNLPQNKIENIFPQLHDKTSMTALDAHYFHQQIWLFEQVLNSKPNHHYDFGSTYHLSGYLSKIVTTTFCDIRPIDVKLPNLSVQNEDLTRLTFKDSSIESASCLHVIEHIGLGRYGDYIDVLGSKKAAEELSRIIAPGGTLYLSTPIGKEIVYFNAHRVFNPNTILSMFSDFELVNFSAVDDSGNFLPNVSPQDFKNAQYSCGMFVLRKKK